MLIDTDELLPLLYNKFPDEVPETVSDMRGLGVKVGEQRTIKYIEYIIENKKREATKHIKKSTK